MDSDEPGEPAEPGANPPGGDDSPSSGQDSRSSGSGSAAYPDYADWLRAGERVRGGIAGGGGSHLSCSGRGCDSLFGSAKLCTESGQTYTFNLHGAVHSWWSTDGAATSVDLTDSPPLPDGWVVALHGVWHGPALQLSSPDNSFTEVFTPRGAIRTVTSTADAGTAQTTIRYGADSDFTAACQGLAG